MPQQYEKFTKQTGATVPINANVQCYFSIIDVCLKVDLFVVLVFVGNDERMGEINFRAAPRGKQKMEQGRNARLEGLGPSEKTQLAQTKPILVHRVRHIRAKHTSLTQ